MLSVHGKMQDKLIKLRHKIDEIDLEIARLIEKRVEIVREIGKLKIERDMKIRDMERENEILENVSKSTILDKDFIRELFARIIDYCRNVEYNLNNLKINAPEVAVLGPKGTFTEIAARKIFKDCRIRYCDTVDEVFDAVSKGIDFGVVAIENSLEGSINITMDCLLEYDVKIYKEIILDINLCLVTTQETNENEILAVISHPQALAQARRFLRKRFPSVKLQRHESTAAAILELKNLRGYAAIGPRETAIEYGMKILYENIEDAKSQTRFIVISKREGKGGKTSIIFALRDRPGALYHLLKEFAERNINLTKIESRPSKRKLGEYFFFMDFEGSLNDKNVKDAIDKTTFLKILGSYQSII